MYFEISVFVLKIPHPLTPHWQLTVFSILIYFYFISFYVATVWIVELKHFHIKFIDFFSPLFRNVLVPSRIFYHSVFWFQPPIPINTTTTNVNRTRSSQRFTRFHLFAKQFVQDEWTMNIEQTLTQTQTIDSKKVPSAPSPIKANTRFLMWCDQLIEIDFLLHWK